MTNVDIGANVTVREQDLKAKVHSCWVNKRMMEHFGQELSQQEMQDMFSNDMDTLNAPKNLSKLKHSATATEMVEEASETTDESCTSEITPNIGQENVDVTATDTDTQGCGASETHLPPMNSMTEAEKEEAVALTENIEEMDEDVNDSMETKSVDEGEACVHEDPMMHLENYDPRHFVDEHCATMRHPVHKCCGSGCRKMFGDDCKVNSGNSVWTCKNAKEGDHHCQHALCNDCHCKLTILNDSVVGNGRCSRRKKWNTWEIKCPN